MKKLLLAPASALLSVVALAAPAHAAGRIDVPNGVIYPGCTTHQASYVAENSNWDLSADVYDETGSWANSFYLYGSTPRSGTTTGDDGLLFCAGWDRPGAYSVEGEYCYSYSDFCTDFTDTFTMRKAYSKSSLAVSDTTANYGQQITLKGYSKAEYKTGYFYNKYAAVRFQRKDADGWKTFATRSTGDTGVAKVTVTWNYKTTKAVRVVTAATDEYQASYTNVTWIY